MSTTAAASGSFDLKEFINRARHNGKRITTLTLDHKKLMASAKLIELVGEIESQKALIQDYALRNSPVDEAQRVLARLEQTLIQFIKANLLSPGVGQMWKGYTLRTLPSQYSTETALEIDLKMVAATVNEFIGDFLYASVVIDPETFSAYADLLKLVRKYTKVRFGEVLLALLPVVDKEADNNDE